VAKDHDAAEFSRVIARRLLTIAACVVPASLPAQSAPLSAFAQRKAEVLLRDHLPCLGCHQFGDSGGRLAPDLATVRQRRSPEYIAAIVADPQRVRPGSMMPKHTMPASQERLIVQYLASRPGSATGAVESPAAPRLDASAAALYGRFCAGCHGTEGAGDGPNARFLPVPPAAHRSAEQMSRRPDDSLFDAIASGGAVMNRSARMPAFGATLTPEEIQGLVMYIRMLCQCEGPAWSRDGGRR
jgi:mono/diheme cytochrome c family protein